MEEYKATCEMYADLWTKKNKHKFDNCERCNWITKTWIKILFKLFKEELNNEEY